MMYAKSTGGFYSASIHGDCIPDDAVQIDGQVYADLLASQASGKRIVAADNGYPMAADAPPPSDDQRVIAIKRAARDVIDARLPDWKQNNLIARALEITAKRVKGEALTADELKELSHFESEWSWVKAVRTRSDEAEANGEIAGAIVWPAPPAHESQN